MTAGVFIGRSRERADAVESLCRLEDGVVWDVTGVHGVGKSTLLNRVAHEVKQLDGPPTVLPVELYDSGLDDGFQGDWGPGASAAVLWQTFVRSRELMLSAADRMVRDYRSEDFEFFRQVAADEGKRADRYIHAHGPRVAAGAAGAPSVADQAVRATIREHQRSVDDAFVEAWEAFTARRRVLVTVDCFESVALTELGQWVVRLSLRLPRTLTLLARTPGPSLGGETDRLVQRHMTHFTEEEVGAYLVGRLGDHPSVDGLASAVFDYTDGHPGGTALAAKLIVERGSDVSPKELRRLLDRLPDDPERRWSKLVELIVEAVRDPVLRDAVGAAAVARSFDAPLLAALLGDHGDRQVTGAVKALIEHRLAQPVRQGQRPNRFRLVEFVRLALDEDLRDQDPDRWRALHGRAAAYYFERLQEEEQDLNPGSYGQWYRYERREWQANKRDWLHHSGRLLRRRELTRARFLLVFLEAFWWWGCYEKFDFTQRLVEDWERAISVWSDSTTSETYAKDQQLADALWFLLNHYPTGYRKPASAAWEEMASKLRLVESLCDLEAGWTHARDVEQRRQLALARALVNVFLAHTRRFRDPMDPGADRYYAIAITLLQGLGDDEWMLAWLDFETADLAIERARIEEANRLIGESARRLLASMGYGEEVVAAGAGVRSDHSLADVPVTGWDYELLANLHRARADALWLAGRPVEAAREYGRAVASAYWFQGHPHPPDEYTLRFYCEMTERTSERIDDVARGDEDVAAGFVQAVRSELPGDGPVRPLVAAVPEGEGASLGALYPRGPAGTELRSDDSPFLDAWRQLWEMRSDPVAELLELVERGHPQPPVPS